MVKVTRSNPDFLRVLAERLKGLDGVETAAGWFETSRYEDGTPVAKVAEVQEFGAHINHPGGTHYKIGPDGRAIFVSSATPGADSLPKTKPHVIVIPPRPFMRPTAERERGNWLKLMEQGSKAVVKGQITGFQALDAIGGRAAADIAKTITQVTAPQLKAGTIAARRRALTNKKIVGALDKPLVASGKLLGEVTHRTEKEP